MLLCLSTSWPSLLRAWTSSQDHWYHDRKDVNSMPNSYIFSLVVYWEAVWERMWTTAFLVCREPNGRHGPSNCLSMDRGLSDYEHVLFLKRTFALFPAPTWAHMHPWIQFQGIFWPLQASGMHVVHRCICRQNPQTHKIKISKFKKKFRDKDRFRRQRDNGQITAN